MSTPTINEARTRMQTQHGDAWRGPFENWLIAELSTERAAREAAERERDEQKRLAEGYLSEIRIQREEVEKQRRYLAEVERSLNDLATKIEDEAPDQELFHQIRMILVPASSTPYNGLIDAAHELVKQRDAAERGRDLAQSQFQELSDARAKFHTLLMGALEAHSLNEDGMVDAARMLRIERDEACQWIDSEPDWKDKFMAMMKETEAARDSALARLAEVTAHMALARTEAGCPDDETLVVHCRELRKERQQFEDNWHLTTGMLQKSRDFLLAAETDNARLRTAAQNVVNMWDFLGPAVDQHYAEKVELTLNAARAALATPLPTPLLDEVRADTARLDTAIIDWLEAHPEKLSGCTWVNAHVGRIFNFIPSATIGECHKTLRGAATAALALGREAK